MSDTFQLAVGTQALAARQRVQGIALREVIAALSVSQAAQVRERLSQQVRGDTERPVMAIPAVDEAAADELAALLEVLSAK